MSEENQAKFDKFFNDYNEGNRPAYITEYPEAEIHTVNPEFVGLVKSFGIMISPNNRIAICATLTEEATAAGYKIKTANAGGSMEAPKDNGDGTVTYYTNNTSIHGLMSTIFEIIVTDSAGKEVAKTNYSLATYIKGIEGQEGVDVAKALYTFGKAAWAARLYLSTL